MEPTPKREVTIDPAAISDEAIEQLVIGLARQMADVTFDKLGPEERDLLLKQLTTAGALEPMLDAVLKRLVEGASKKS